MRTSDEQNINSVIGSIIFLFSLILSAASVFLVAVIFNHCNIGFMSGSIATTILVFCFPIISVFYVFRVKGKKGTSLVETILIFLNFSFAILVGIGEFFFNNFPSRL